MAVLTIPDEDLKVEGEAEIRAHLAGLALGLSVGICHACLTMLPRKRCLRLMPPRSMR